MIRLDKGVLGDILRLFTVSYQAVRTLIEMRVVRFVERLENFDGGSFHADCSFPMKNPHGTMPTRVFTTSSGLISTDRKS